MPAPSTDKQQRFALEYARNGGNATAAAKSAGYSPKSSHEIGRQLLEISHVQESIHRELMRSRFRSGAVGLNALMRIAEDDSAPAAARVSASRALLEHAGMVGGTKDEQEARKEMLVMDNVDYNEVLQRIGQAGRA